MKEVRIGSYAILITTNLLIAGDFRSVPTLSNRDMLVEHNVREISYDFLRLWENFVFVYMPVGRAVSGRLRAGRHAAQGGKCRHR